MQPTRRSFLPAPSLRKLVQPLLLGFLGAGTGGVAASAPALDLHLAGTSGMLLVDSGLMVVTGRPRSERTEVFEYLRRADGGWVLINTITAKDGRYRVSGRFDYSSQWQAESALGAGLYRETPVAIEMIVDGLTALTRVDGEGIAFRAKGECDPDCFIDMSPNGMAMFVMTRHYDHDTGGPQTFRWVGQGLSQNQNLSDGLATLSYVGRREIQHDGAPVEIDHYTFVESLPTPDGGRFELNFDLWTDAAHRPMGFRIGAPGPGSTMGVRQGFENTLAQIMAR